MEAFTEIRQSLLALYPFTEEQLTLFTDRLVCQKLAKKELLLQKGQVSDGLSFVISGSLRFYTQTRQREVTLTFFTENNWVADLESVLTQQASLHYIEATEDTNIASLSLKDIHWLMDRHPSFRMLNALVAPLAIPTAHMTALSTQSPDERYQDLLQKHPDWIRRFPQKQIASYLGIMPETLSRVRARVM